MDLNLELVDIHAIATLPRLKSLDISFGFTVGDGALSGLSRCRGLRRLALESRGIYASGLDDVLPIIGRRLLYLDLGDCYASTALDVVKHCPNLEYLALRIDNHANISTAEFKSGLKRLAKLELNVRSILLGTEWEGYR